MSNKEIGLAPYHIPKVASGHYNINASLDNKLNNGLAQNINFHVAGYNASIPQNEILAVYPPIEHTGNFAGTFPHIQFRRSTLPWEYKIEGRIKEEDCKKALLLKTSEDKFNFINENNIEFDQKVYEKITKEKDKLEFLDSILNAVYKFPYVFLILLKEEELKAFEVINTDTNQLTGSTESPEEPKPLKVIKFNNSKLFPKADVMQKLAHVRVQKHNELKDLNLPKETSILVSHRRVEPNTKYKAFVCYYVNLNSDNKYSMITNLSNTTASNFVVVLNEWSFESIGADLYQIDINKLQKHPSYKSFSDNLQDSEIASLDTIKSKANSKLLELIQNNEKYIAERDKKWKTWKKENEGQPIDIFEKFVETITIEKVDYKDNHILEYLQYNGKNLKGYLHELEVEPFKTNQFKNNTSDSIQKLLNIAKVPLEHQLKAGGKMVSWYQGPFTNNTCNFNLLQLLADQKIETIPDHQDYLNLFNEDTGMYDMTYSAAWQLGRLMIMNDNKVLQELKKWKYDLELYNLVAEQDKLSHLPDLSIQEPSIPDVLMNYVTELVQFRNFPLYYLLPHSDLSTEESIKYFKIDNAWILAFLFGIFSAGPKLTLKDFKHYLLYKPRQMCFDEFYSKLENIKSELLKINEGLVKESTNKYDQISLLYSEIKECMIRREKEYYSVEKEMKFEELQIKVAELSEFNSVLVMMDKLSKESNNSVLKENLDKILKFKEYLHRIKKEFHYIANYHREYYGIVLHSQAIKNWPHLVVELNESHDFHYVTSINNSLRLYVTGTKISSVEMYLKNENAHFGKEYKRDDNQFIITDQDSVTTANNSLYKQPRVVFNVKNIN